MIVDFHTHVFPPEVIRGREGFARRDEAFALLYGDPRSRMATAGQLGKVMSQEGVDRAVVFGFPWKDSGILRMANAYLLEAQRKEPARFVAFCTPSPAGTKSSLRDVEAGLDQGMAGIGEAALYAAGMGRKAWRYLGSLAAIARERGLPLVLHANEPVGHSYPGKTDIGLKDLGSFVEEHQATTLVLAHWGGGFFFYELMKSVRRSTANVHYDTAASPYLYSPLVYRIAVEIVGADRILFGTDYPLIAPSRYRREIEEAGLGPEDRRSILGENATRLLAADIGG